jgi:hypothetical protein
MGFLVSIQLFEIMHKFSYTEWISHEFMMVNHHDYAPMDNCDVSSTSLDHVPLVYFRRDHRTNIHVICCTM